MTKHCLNLDNTLSWYSLICGNPTHQRHQCAIIKRTVNKNERRFLHKVKAIHCGMKGLSSAK